MIIILLTVLILLAKLYFLLMARQTKNSKEFNFVVLKQYTSKFVFMLQHRLFNLTPNMLEVGHPKHSLFQTNWLRFRQDGTLEKKLRVLSM